MLASLGFRALATTSSGFAATLGRPDGSVTRDEALAHAAAIVAADGRCRCRPTSRTASPTIPAGVAETVRRAVDAGLAGCSIEDFDRADRRPDLRRRAGGRAGRARRWRRAGERLVITARAENHLHGRADLADTIARLQRYAGGRGHVLYAPGV